MTNRRRTVQSIISFRGILKTSPSLRGLACECSPDPSPPEAEWAVSEKRE
jgi:hypothetical protein